MGDLCLYIQNYKPYIIDIKRITLFFVSDQEIIFRKQTITKQVSLS